MLIQKPSAAGYPAGTATPRRGPTVRGKPAALQTHLDFSMSLKIFNVDTNDIFSRMTKKSWNCISKYKFFNIFSKKTPKMMSILKKCIIFAEKL